ncbi:MAG: IS630 family transposase [Candidatus Woesearchaeota archaeon]|nr:MAG: IS630 family transposase [Candidatus Woesearchaeota archaeon]GIX41439.1 MAG: IS630 family transposase [Leptospiraceae bacterium]GIX42942.1 MAG: IS630 family transposase [Leptospiraceae bacterium]
MKANFLTEEQKDIIKKQHRAIKNKKIADRLKAILLLNDGYTYEQVAHILLLDETTIRNYIKRYREKGIEGLIEDNYQGKIPFLNEEQIQELDEHLSQKVYTTIKEIREYIKKRFGIYYSLEGVRKLLHKMGYVYKKTKQIPAKADKEKQERFMEKYKFLKASKSEEDQIYFVDAVHVIHNSMPSYGWIKKGKEKNILSNTGRKGINIKGAYNVETKEVVIKEAQKVNSEVLISLIDELQYKQKKGNIILILDNARYNRSKLIQEYLKQNSRVKISYLPPYSPNLNLIERLWKFFKKKILYNKYYESFDAFRDSCIQFFKNIEMYRNELNSLMTENFCIINSS